MLMRLMCNKVDVSLIKERASAVFLCVFSIYIPLKRRALLYLNNNLKYFPS